MMDNPDFVFYAMIGGGAVVVLVFAYQIMKRLKKHGTTHKPQVMNKIKDFYSTQDSSHLNY